MKVSSNRTGRGGFSLIELMVVLLLIGIMTALIVPEMKGTYGDAVLRSSARKLIEAINLANSRAITLNQLHQVHLERKPGRYVVERKGQQGERSFLAVSDISGAQGEIDSRIFVDLHKTTEEQSPSTDESQSAYDDMREQQSQDAVAFYPDGTADPAEIILRDRDGFRLYLRINPVTARVDLIDLDRQ